jgi:hypothetical protein
MLLAMNAQEVPRPNVPTVPKVFTYQFQIISNLTEHALQWPLPLLRHSPFIWPQLGPQHTTQVFWMAPWPVLLRTLMTPWKRLWNTVPPLNPVRPKSFFSRVPKSTTSWGRAGISISRPRSRETNKTCSSLLCLSSVVLLSCWTVTTSRRKRSPPFTTRGETNSLSGWVQVSQFRMSPSTALTQ